MGIKDKRKKLNLCDEDCNNCLIVNHSNSRMLTYIFNKLYDKLGNKVYKIIQKNCPNLTVCYDCRIDDFWHFENCKLKNEKNEIVTDKKTSTFELLNVLLNDYGRIFLFELYRYMVGHHNDPVNKKGILKLFIKENKEESGREILENIINEIKRKKNQGVY